MYSRCIHTRFEKTLEYIAEIMEDISTLNSVKIRGSNCYFKCEATNTKLQKTWNIKKKMQP